MVTIYEKISELVVEKQLINQCYMKNLCRINEDSDIYNNL